MASTSLILIRLKFLIIAVIKWMEYIKFNKNFIFSNIFRHLYEFLCFHAGNGRYIFMIAMKYSKEIITKTLII
jgi:hypothetical protein